MSINSVNQQNTTNIRKLLELMKTGKSAAIRSNRVPKWQTKDGSIFDVKNSQRIAQQNPNTNISALDNNDAIKNLSN